MRLLFLLITIVFSSSAFASIDYVAAEKLIRDSGVDRQLDALRHQLEKGISEAREQRRNVSDDRWNSLEEMVRTSFAENRLLPEIIEDVAEQMSEADLVRIQNFKDSDLGKKIHRLEEAASAPELSEKKLNALQTMSPDDLRLQRITELDKQLGTSMSLVDLSINLQTALVALTTSTQPRSMRPDIDMIKATLDMNRFEFQVETKSQVLSSFIYTYEKLSDEEMVRFLDFVKSPVGNRYHKLMVDSLISAVRQATDELTAKLSNI